MQTLAVRERRYQGEPCRETYALLGHAIPALIWASPPKSLYIFYVTSDFESSSIIRFSNSAYSVLHLPLSSSATHSASHFVLHAITDMRFSLSYNVRTLSRFVRKLETVANLNPSRFSKLKTTNIFLRWKIITKPLKVLIIPLIFTLLLYQCICSKEWNHPPQNNDFFKTFLFKNAGLRCILIPLKPLYRS